MPRERPAPPVRLNKAIAHAGICSRRKADALISQGRVRVNDRVQRELGVSVTPGVDSLEVDGQPVAFGAARAPEDAIHLAFHKPPQVMSTMHDPQRRPTLVDYLSDSLRAARVLPVGRLDFLSEGLLLLTNDYALIHALTHPSRHLPKTYLIHVLGALDDAQLAEMRAGMTLEDGTTVAGVKVSIQRRTRQGGILKLLLHQGVNRQIRRMCAQLDLRVHRLIRTKHGPVSLGELEPGKIRRLKSSVFRNVER